MTHAEKVAYFIEDMRRRGVRANIAAPHLFRLAWMLGLKTPPPLFLGFWGNFLWAGGFMASFALAPGVLAWWSRPTVATAAGALVALAAAVGLGALPAAAWRWRARKYQLPSWNRYMSPGTQGPPAASPQGGSPDDDARRRGGASGGQRGDGLVRHRPPARPVAPPGRPGEHEGQQRPPMTESEWNACTDPMPMLEFLHGKASDRKLRLFACAYARMGSWLGAFRKVCGDHFYNGQWQKPAIDVDAAQAALLALRLTPGGGLTFRGCPPFGDLGEQEVAVAERYADGLAGGPEFEGHRAPVVRRLNRAAEGAAYCGPSAFRDVEQWAVLRAALAPTGWDAAAAALRSVEHYFVSVADSGERRGMNPDFRAPVRRQTLAQQADLLREIFGPLPFHPLAIDPSVSAWNDGTARKLAQAVYEDRAFDRLPLLADALEDAGCSDAAILVHCRQPGEHVRGCWALDLVLGKWKTVESSGGAVV